MVLLNSPTPPPPLPRCSVFDYLFPAAEDAGKWYSEPPADGVALIDGLDGTMLTRSQLRDQALSVGAFILGKGLKSGDVALVFGTNSLHWVAAALGCQAAGVVVSPANAG